jgi:cell wall-associated NlpC family hydrolase
MERDNAASSISRKDLHQMDARSALAAVAITAVTLPASGHISPAPDAAVSGLHITGDWTESFQARWESESGVSGYAIEVRDSAGATVRNFTTDHDYANVGGLLPGKTYVLTVRANAPGSTSASVTIRTTQLEPFGQKIAQYARAFVGRAKYEYGATGPSAFDCSGLAQYVYRHFGRTIPRTAQEQFQYFRPETSKQAHPGDLVFFGSSPVTHVGIFEGGDMMVAAATPLEGIRYQQIYSSSATFGTLNP